MHGSRKMGVRIYRTHNVRQVSQMRSHKHARMYRLLVSGLHALEFMASPIFDKFEGSIRSQVISRSDQLLPYYVMDVAADVPGLPGLFLAGLVSAGLSTMSANLNTAAGTIYEDFIDPWLPDSPNKELRAATIMKVKDGKYHDRSVIRREIQAN